MKRRAHSWKDQTALAKSHSAWVGGQAVKQMSGSEHLLVEEVQDQN